MRNNLDSLIRSGRAVKAPPQDAFDRNRQRLMRSVLAGATTPVATREAAADAASETIKAGPLARPGGWTAGWTTVSILAAIVAMSWFAARAYSFRHSAAEAPPLRAAASSTSTHRADMPSMSDSRIPQTSDASTFSVVTALTVTPPSPPAPTPTKPSVVPTAPSARNGQEAASPKSDNTGLTMQPLERELQLLRSAGRSLDADKPVEALARLDQYANEFPHGTLKPEYEAARIRALCEAGHVAAARQARDQFIEQNPGSPLADALRATCTGER